MKNITLDLAMLADLGLIRGTLETRDQFPLDDPIREECQNIVEDARNGFLRRLHELADLSPADLRMSGGAFKDAAINLMLLGLPRSSLSLLGREFLLGEIDALRGRYVYELSEPTDVFAVQSLSPEDVYALFVSDVLCCAGNDDNYASKRVFDRNVYNRFLALLYTIESAGGRFFREEDGGQEHEAPVPRHPITPQLTGEAEEAIPEAEGALIDVLR